MRIPAPPLADISLVEHVIPAAPISCIPMSAPVLITSRLASRSNFSWKGSPTCTAGKSSSAFSDKSFEAKAAPAIPSFPVAAPTMYTGFPAPCAVADTV